MAKFLVGYHYAKTGGSTLAGHIHATLGAGSVVPVGASSRVSRFFDGERFPEELGPEDFASARLLYGHGVDETTLHCLPPDMTADFVFLTRDPIKHYKSRMVHATQARQRFRNEVKVRLQTDDSPVSTTLCDRFPSFIADDAGTLEEKVISILRCFRFTLSTDRLNDQMPSLMQWLGAPAEIVPRRVRNTGGLPLDPDLEQKIAAGCAVDGRINDVVKTGAWDPASESLNAFGFDPERRDRALRRLRDGRPSREALMEQGYTALVNALRTQGCLHAALAFLDAGKAGIGSPDHLRAKVCAAIQGKAMSPRERLQRANIFLKLGALDAARQDVEVLGPDAPLGVEGHRIAAEVHLQFGRPGLAREHTQAALRIAPEDPRTRALHRRAGSVSAKVFAVASRVATMIRPTRG